ncbi:MAG: ABC transporter ATP-binding protein [Desulfobulbaceae bacterium]|nr:ABC transporter ATP-binding protein [Desulfobulbaceae bacterium]
MIRLEGLSKSYGTVQAVRGIDLQVQAGELFAFLGPNGAGKSTTIRMLTGLTRLGGGNAWLNGYNIRRDALAAKRQCGLVAQQSNLDNELTVSENLDIHGRLFAMPARERRERIAELLSFVELSDRAHSSVKTLSGGMKRRVMIARALMHRPPILFLDEPTVGLDAAIRRRIWALLKRTRQEGSTLFLTTHYIEEAEFLADRVAFLDQGEIVAMDTPQQLMARLGLWAIDQLSDEGLSTSYFPTREEAAAFCTLQAHELTLRRVNLEDVFLDLTGKKVR